MASLNCAFQHANVIVATKSPTLPARVETLFENSVATIGRNTENLFPAAHHESLATVFLIDICRLEIDATR
jgi:hypothetical protein